MALPPHRESKLLRNRAGVEPSHEIVRDAEGAPDFIKRELRGGGGGVRDGLLWRSQQDEDYTDEDEDTDVAELCAWDRVVECLVGHYRGVSEAGPCGEGDQAAMR